MVLKAIGALLVAWGIADLAGSWLGFDVWWQVAGVRLQGVFYQFSGWAALILGALFWTMGSGPNGGKS